MLECEKNINDKTAQLKGMMDNIIERLNAIKAVEKSCQTERSPSCNQSFDRGELAKCSHERFIEELMHEVTNFVNITSQQQPQYEYGRGLEQSINDVTKHNDVLLSAIQKCEQTILQHSAELDRIRNENTDLRKYQDQLEEHLIERDLKIQNLIKDFSRANSTLDFHQSNANNLDQDNATRSELLRQAQSRLQQNELDLANAANDVRLLAEEKNELLNRIHHLQTKNDESNQKIEELQNVLQEFVNKQGALEYQLNIKNNELNKCDQKLQTMKCMINNTAEEIKMLKNDFTADKLELIHERDVARKQCECNEMIIRAAKAQIMELKSNLNDLRNANQTANLEIGASKELVTHLRHQLAIAEQREIQCQNILKTTKDHLENSKKKLTFLTDVEMELTCTRQQNDKLAKQNAELVENYEVLHEDSEQLRIDYEELLGIRDHSVSALEIMKNINAERQSREEAINKKMEKQSEHIESLLEDRRLMADKLHAMHRDLLISRKSNDKSGSHSGYYSMEESSSQADFRYGGPDQYPNGDCLMQHLRKATKKLSRTRREISNEINQLC